jgi:hypothetical protein
MEGLIGKQCKYRVSPVVNSGVKLITLPWSFLAEEMSNVANMVTMADHAEASARYRPDCGMVSIIKYSLGVESDTHLDICAGLGQRYTVQGHHPSIRHCR